MRGRRSTAGTTRSLLVVSLKFLNGEPLHAGKPQVLRPAISCHIWCASTLLTTQILSQGGLRHTEGTVLDVGSHDLPPHL
ncbi:hypothetical protein BGZ57DRAFT_916607 [Hyaloscypha finlandica]|nr:hypothetical protein BGZ57DRAFT_916607 [Hyaloscypha finlandica]